MSKRLPFSLIAAVAALAFSSPVQAQDRSAVSGAELDVAVLATPAHEGVAVRQFLSTEQVQEVAEQLGVNAPDLAAHVEAMDDATLARLAQQGGLDEQALAGGADRIVISTTAIIIGLLILILVTT
jgi:uncharacterized protein YidB (DUF937 family)